MASDVTAPDCLNITFDCSQPIPTCRDPAGFDFPSLNAILQRYWQQCPDGPWLFRRRGWVGDLPYEEASLINDVCEAIAGRGWKKYPDAVIWDRLTTWKFPLFQLISTSPRPPLGFWEETFFIVHLLGDPIGSIQDLIHKIGTCHSRASRWKSFLNQLSLVPSIQDSQIPKEVERQRLHEVLTLIIVSYDEWGTHQGDLVAEYLERELTWLDSAPEHRSDRERFLEICTEHAEYLAADRSTKFLPIAVAQLFFIGNVIIAIVRTRSAASGPNPQAYIDIEVYSIGFTALFFWVIAAVTLASVVGTSQTAPAIPRILNGRAGLRQNLCNSFPQRRVDLPEESSNSSRYYQGGIYSWQPTTWSWDTLEGWTSLVEDRSHATTRKKWPGPWTWHIRQRFRTLMALSSVSCGPVIGMILTSRVPPVSWSCRTEAEMWFLIAWLVSFLCTGLLWPRHDRHHRRRFWLTFAKDCVTIIATLGYVIVTQIGIFNKCSCYTRNGHAGLALPELPVVRNILEHRLDRQYMAITMTGIVIQLLVIPGIVMAVYPGAVVVFLQRDDGELHLRRFRKIGEWFHQSWNAVNGKWVNGRKTAQNTKVASYWKAARMWGWRRTEVHPIEGCELGSTAPPDNASVALLGVNLVQSKSGQSIASSTETT